MFSHSPCCNKPLADLSAVVWRRAVRLPAPVASATDDLRERNRHLCVLGRWSGSGVGTRAGR